MFLLNMSLEISNIYSLLLYRYLFWYFLGGGRGEGGINFSADCLGGSENLYGPWGGGGYKKNEPLKKKSSAPPCRIHNECSLKSVSWAVIYNDTTGQLRKRKNWQGEEWLKRSGWGWWVLTDCHWAYFFSIEKKVNCRFQFRPREFINSPHKTRFKGAASRLNGLKNLA